MLTPVLEKGLVSYNYLHRLLAEFLPLVRAILPGNSPGKSSRAILLGNPPGQSSRAILPGNPPGQSSRGSPAC